MNSSGLKIRKSHTYTHPHIHTSGCQLKIIFLDVLDHSKYSDKYLEFFSRKHSFLSEEVKASNPSKILFLIKKNIYIQEITLQSSL